MSEVAICFGDLEWALAARPFVVRFRNLPKARHRHRSATPMLMGAADKEAPPAGCFLLLETVKAAGAPIDWFIYPGITHGRDSRNRSAGYVYDETTTRDATRRMIAFFRSAE